MEVDFVFGLNIKGSCEIPGISSRLAGFQLLGEASVPQGCGRQGEKQGSNHMLLLGDDFKLKPCVKHIVRA
ncbi:hypothetical protein L6164_002774 [Bauhinia variegata]|uniref:Uncharacterized protein n=1 Tax=Bauhinia variegata TaxID=167791 RepID=A0ACB9Q1W9_BAUVA|nr:hypothetical protein L6164_002774 [Bauhinia variegata]